jgi:hypothetical protein
MPVPITSRVFSKFPCNSFTVIGLTLRYLMHFGFIFVQGKSTKEKSTGKEYKRCSFSLWHVDNLFSQHRLLKKLSPLPNLIVWDPLSKIKCL